MRATWMAVQERVAGIWQCIRCGEEAPRTDGRVPTPRDRRNAQQRAATMGAVVRCLCGSDACSTEMLCRALESAPAAAAERIVKWLAVRGLARNVGPGTWVATVPLRRPAPLGDGP